ETLTGGTNTDIVFLGSGGNTLLANAVEVLVGGSGIDVVTLGSTGNTIALRDIETLVGSSNSDVVFLGDIGNTLTVSGVLIVIGGTATDVVTMGSAGTLITRGVETLVGSSGSDIIRLGDTSNTLSVSVVESLVGGTSSDVVMVTGGSVRFAGGLGVDTVTLQTSAGTDQIVYTTDGEGGAAGANTGNDVINNFQSGTDSAVITGALRTFVDRNGSGALDGATRAQGAVNLATDEVVRLSTVVASLADTDLASFRTALGTLTNSSANANALVLANDGTNTGLYLVVDANGDGQVAATEARLLARFNIVLLGPGDISLD
ncbi:calcium-binding protein, partial [Azospirillum doebereinerae]|nr:calcium-binding protein [Azospirillum doebereinerae]